MTSQPLKVSALKYNHRLTVTLNCHIFYVMNMSLIFSPYNINPDMFHVSKSPNVQMSIDLLPTELLAQILVYPVKRWSVSQGHDWTKDGVESQRCSNAIFQDLLDCSMVNRIHASPRLRGALLIASVRHVANKHQIFNREGD